MQPAALGHRGAADAEADSVHAIKPLGFHLSSVQLVSVHFLLRKLFMSQLAPAVGAALPNMDNAVCVCSSNVLETL